LKERVRFLKGWGRGGEKKRKQFQPLDGPRVQTLRIKRRGYLKREEQKPGSKVGSLTVPVECRSPGWER